MIRIRLAKSGKKNNPFYHIVATEARSKNNGENLFTFGYWHPASKDLSIDKKAISEFVAKGAQLSAAVEKLLKGGSK